MCQIFGHIKNFKNSQYSKKKTLHSKNDYFDSNKHFKTNFIFFVE